MNIIKRQLIVIGCGVALAATGFVIYNMLFAGIGTGLVLSTIAFNEYKEKKIAKSLD